MNITVIGAGLMGHGIALTFSLAGHHVKVQDPIPEALDALHDRVTASLKVMNVDSKDRSEALQKIFTEKHLSKAVKDAELVIEAAPEKLDLKKQIFKEIEYSAPKTCLLASNTSVIQISKIMCDLKLKNRVVGTHWWNPPHIIPLVEVIKTEWTDEETMNQMMDTLSNAGKTPVRVEKDVPGFIGNRLQMALWREAISLVENGICDAASVDTVVKASFGRRLAILGPMENADLVGTDLTLDIHNQVLFDLERRAGPSPFLQKLVSENKLGMKSGTGFQNWTEDQIEETRVKLATHLLELEGILKK